MVSTCGVDKKSKTASWCFNPFEVAFCGYSGSGKTTLITKLIRLFRDQWSIGYYKHDAHRFEIDHEGKDSWRGAQAGATGVLITSSDKGAWCSQEPLDSEMERSLLQNYDALFIEGFKNLNFPKILLLDQKEKLLKEFQEGRYSHVQALIYPSSCPDLSEINIPCFHRDDIQSIALFIEQLFLRKIKKIPVRGLVLDGGKSSRMGSHKGSLRYYNVPHTQYIAELLEMFCEEVHISRRPGQKIEQGTGRWSTIEDQFLEMGPLGGILSALRNYPDSAWMVLACDLPFMDKETLKQLSAARNPLRMATAFQNPENNLPEPLCAIYEPKIYARALQLLGQGYSCPRKLLLKSRIELLNTDNISGLHNANTPEDFLKAKKKIVSFESYETELKN